MVLSASRNVRFWVLGRGRIIRRVKVYIQVEIITNHVNNSMSADCKSSFSSNQINSSTVQLNVTNEHTIT